MERLKVKAVAAKLAEYKGNVSAAARAFGVSRQTLYNYVERYPTLRQVIDDAREEMIDGAVDALGAAVARGEAWAVCFFLKTQGKSRGYVERQEVSGPNGAPIQVQPIDYRAAIAPLAPPAGGSVGDSDAPGEDQGRVHGPQVG